MTRFRATFKAVLFPPCRLILALTSAPASTSSFTHSVWEREAAMMSVVAPSCVCVCVCVCVWVGVGGGAVEFVRLGMGSLCEGTNVRG